MSLRHMPDGRRATAPAVESPGSAPRPSGWFPADLTLPPWAKTVPFDKCFTPPALARSG